MELFKWYLDGESAIFPVVKNSSNIRGYGYFHINIKDYPKTKRIGETYINMSSEVDRLDKINTPMKNSSAYSQILIRDVFENEDDDGVVEAFQFWKVIL